jgi:hypothetical protein
MDLLFGRTYSSLIDATLGVTTAQSSLSGPSQHRLPGYPPDPFAFINFCKGSSRQPLCTTG